MIKELKCKNCASSNFIVYGKLLECKYCGTLYVSDNAIGTYEDILIALGFSLIRIKDNTIKIFKDSDLNEVCFIVNSVDECDFLEIIERFKIKDRFYKDGISI